VRKLLILVLAALTGCYSYAPVRGVRLAPGTAVRARLNAPSDFRLTDLSVNGAVRVNGEVVTQGSDTLVLSAFSLRALSGLDFPAAGETVRIPNERLAGLERRKVDLLRSAALAAAAGLLGVVAFSAFRTEGSPGGGSPAPRPQ
jgi:hypothetical protein